LCAGAWWVDNAAMNTGWLLAPALLALAACSPPSGSQAGSLGNGYFTYGCVSAEDAYCPNVLDGRPFPAQVALGARFEATFEEKIDLARSSSYGALHVEPVAPDMLAAAGQTFESRIAGRAGLLAVTEGGEVVDTTTIAVVAPESVTFSGDDGAALGANVTLARGATLAVHAAPFGPLDARLAGVLVCTATTSDAAVIAAVSKAAGARVIGFSSVTGDGRGELWRQLFRVLGG
jgi:hypothetical protein